jgi:hypothetical protein
VAVSDKAAKIIKPGWVILLMGAGGYLLSETRIIGPIWALILILATIFQLNQWRAANNIGPSGII